ncbi:MAG: DinB family protein [Planctomycetaceae bacterium]|nr:DinB family protein [Planctomycetaceae bacterium]
MNAKDLLKSTMTLNTTIMTKYLADLDDADLMRRPSAGSNHLKWQLGHLIASEAGLLAAACPERKIELPAGFEKAHERDQTANDDPAAFPPKQVYLEQQERVRAAVVAAIDSLSEADLDKPAPEQMRNFLPTVGHIFMLIGTHPIMHCGQFAVVRRLQGKPVVI